MSRAAPSYGRMLNILVMLISLAYCEKLQYSWMPETARFDYMVGISINDEPSCSGALIFPDQVVTTATPFIHNGVPDYNITEHKIYAHVIHRTWDDNIGIEVHSIRYQAYAYGYRLQTLDHMGAGIFVAAYDLAVLALTKIVPTHAAALSVRHPITNPGYMKRTSYTTILPSGTFTVLGHGYADRLHVQLNVELEADNYPVETVLVDCDEWVHRSWGKFICILNVDNFVGVTSGGVLAYDGIIVGIGSFALRRGDETILVFTDLRRCLRLYAHQTEPGPTEPMW